jgi:hypothetical protein
MDDSEHPSEGHANHDREDDRPATDGADVTIEELSDSQLRITVGRLITDVTVERIYYTHRSFAEFHSLEELVGFLRKKSEAVE